MGPVPKKRKRVDTGLCARWVETAKQSGKSLSAIAGECRLASRTQVGDVVRKRIEPSKKMITWAIKQGASGHYLLCGEGPRLWEELRTAVDDNKKLRTENKSLILQMEKASAKIEALNELLARIYKGRKP